MGLRINEAANGGQIFYTDGSKSETGKAGGGWFVVAMEGIKESCRGMGSLATVWDGEVTGMRGALEVARDEEKVLIMSDSQAAIMAITAAGETGKARTADCSGLSKR